MFNLKVDRQISRKYFKSDAIYNGSAGMTLYYYMCRSWQDCCRRGRTGLGHPYQLNQLTVSAGVWTPFFYAFIVRLTVEERLQVFILQSYLKTVYYAHCRQSYFENFRILKMNITRAIVEVNKRTLRKVVSNMVKSVHKCIEMTGHNFQHLL
jgi:hypothetical protein